MSSFGVYDSQGAAVPSASEGDGNDLPFEGTEYPQYLDEDEMSCEEEVHFNYSRNLTQENAVLNTPELDTNSPSYKQNPTATVLQHLDTILQEKINLEIEDFRFSLQNIISEQQSRVHQLIQLAEPRTKLTTPAPIELSSPSAPTELPQIECAPRPDDEKNRCLLELFTCATQLSQNLGRPEYQL